MILTRLDGAIAYRIHTPRRAVSPTSGESAARHGGRANRPGVRALYLALETETAVREYEQISTLLPPGTLVSYEVKIERVVDLRAGYMADNCASLWEDFITCDWRNLWFSGRIAPRVGRSATRSSRPMRLESSFLRRLHRAEPTSSSIQTCSAQPTCFAYPTPARACPQSGRPERPRIRFDRASCIVGTTASRMRSLMIEQNSL